MAKPTLILVHGAWHGPAHFTPLVDYLESHGYKCIAMALPSTHAPSPTTILQDDVEAVKLAIATELENNNVVVVGHSYAGEPVATALRSLDTASRTRSGHTTSVTGLALISAFMGQAGICMLDVFGGDMSKVPLLQVKNQLIHMSPEPGPEVILYHDLPESDARKYATLLKPLSLGVLEGKVEYAGWKDVKVRYLVCEEDRMVPVAAQKGQIDAARALGVTVEAEALPSGHCPFLSRVTETGDFVRRAAGEHSVESTFIPY